MTTVRDRWRRELEAVGFDPDLLRALLERHSGLPGPRANLELAAALGDLAAQADAAGRKVLLDWARLGPEAAPHGTRAEYVPVAAVCALGVLAARPAERARYVEPLRAAAFDPRWRMREAAALGLQRLGELDAAGLVALLRPWVVEESDLLLRLVMVTIAHPPLLDDAAVRVVGWDASERALERVRRRRTESAETLRILVAALSFAPSVYAAAEPREGFRRLGRWAEAREPAVKKIVVANLRKARLAKRYPDECERVAEALAGGVD
jgi:hypothetical protein